MSGKRSTADVKVKASTDDSPKVTAVELESDGDESETADRVKKLVVAKTDGKEENTRLTTTTKGPVTRATKLRGDGAASRSKRKQADNNSSDDENNDVTNENENAEDEKGSETDEAEETCFRIDKVYSVADESNDMDTTDVVGEAGKQKSGGECGEMRDAAGIAVVALDKKDKLGGIKVDAKLKEEKQIKPRIQTATLAKVPTLAGGMGSVRMLAGGVRGASMPFIVSMGAGNPGIPLLPAGLPPGRYVILPGSSSSTSKTATVTTIASNVTSRLATTAAGHTTLVTTQKAISTPSSTPASITPQVTGGGKLYTRERGRRKSYTTGEKLAMIEAVEGGQRKSVVADRFGVAPSTLACILAQRHKIRSEKDNLARRRVRHTRYQLREDQCGISAASTPDQPFTHFLAPLSSPTPTLLDTQPEEIIAVPDLVERVTGSDNKSDGGGDDQDDQDQDHDGSPPEVTMMDHEHHIDSDLRDHHHGIKGKAFHHHRSQSQHSDVGDDHMGSDHQRQSPSPTHGNTTGLVGPYLLKKETHCSTVLDQLMRDDTYTDVTLTAEGQSLRAHRIVLCLASSYFRQVLSREMSVQSVIVLRDIKFAELRNIVHFIYTGEATVDASELESFMRTAEMLEISSLCEGQKCITSRGTPLQSNYTSSFSVGDFERLVGTKRSRKDTSPTSSKARRPSGEGPSSRSSSTEPPPTTNSLALIKEEPNSDKNASFLASPVKTFAEPEFLEGEQASQQESGESERTRRDSTGSVGGFAAIAGVQKMCEGEDGGEVFSPPHPASPSPSPSPVQEATTHSPTLISTDTTAVPGRCPYCPHISQKFEGVAMMRHLLVSHPCKPAFPCDTCWRVFVKRVGFKTHQQTCQQSSGS